MRDNLQAIGARPLAFRPGHRLRGWITRWTAAAPERAAERLETIERLDRERRRAARAGEYVPDVSWHRRWN
jgi:hypothetical protein